MWPQRKFDEFMRSLNHNHESGLKTPQQASLLLPCLYCGVDSGPALQFFVWMIGGGLLAFACLYSWGYVNGKFNTGEGVSQIPLNAEKEDSNV